MISISQGFCVIGEYRMDFKALLSLDFKSLFVWISASFFRCQESFLHQFQNSSLLFTIHLHWWSLYHRDFASSVSTARTGPLHTLQQPLYPWVLFFYWVFHCRCFVLEVHPFTMRIPKAAHSKKSSFQKRHIPKRAHSKKGTFQNRHNSKRSHSEKCTFQKEHILKSTTENFLNKAFYTILCEFMVSSPDCDAKAVR